MSKPDGTEVGLQKVLPNGWRETTYIRPDGTRFHISVPPLELGEDGKTPVKWDEGTELRLYDHISKKACRCPSLCDCKESDFTQGASPFPGNLAPGFMTLPATRGLKVKFLAQQGFPSEFEEVINSWIERNAITVKYVHAFGNMIAIWYEGGEELKK